MPFVRKKTPRNPVEGEKLLFLSLLSFFLKVRILTSERSVTGEEKTDKYLRTVFIDETNALEKLIPDFFKASYDSIRGLFHKQVYLGSFKQIRMCVYVCMCAHSQIVLQRSHILFN